MIAVAVGIGAVLFAARWHGPLSQLPVAWLHPLAGVEWTGAFGRLTGTVAITIIGLIVLAGLLRPGATVRGWLRCRGSGRVVTGWALGVTVLAAIWEGLGLAGLLRVPLAWATIALLAPAGVSAMSRRLREPMPPPVSRWLLAAVLFALPPALVPEIEVDVLSVHLGLPDGWRVAGRITADPGHGVSGFPFAQEALALPALLLGTELPARLTGWAGGVLAALGAVALAEFLGAGAAASWLGGAAVFAMPQLFELSTHAKNDALSVGLVTAALVALLPGSRSAIATAGLLAGSAAATKLTAGLAIPALLIAMLYLSASRRTTETPSRRTWLQHHHGSPLDPLLFLICSSVFLLPWSLRNLLTLGSPGFPMLTGWFPALGRDAVNAQLMHRYAFTWAEVNPDGVVMSIRDAIRLIGGFSPVVGAGLILLAATWRFPSRLRIIAVFALTGALVWLPALAWVSRYALPVLPAVIALSVTPFPALGRTHWLTGLVALSLAACATTGGWGARPLAAALGLESRAAYRTRHLGPYAAATWAIRDLVPAQDRIMVIGDWRRYPSDGRLVAGMSDDQPLLRKLAVDSSRADRLRVKLRQRRIGWLLHWPSQAAFWADYPMRFAWTAAAGRIWATVWDARASAIWRSFPAQDALGSAWLFRLDRRAPDPPFRAWLPGVEGEYARLRVMLNTPGPSPDLLPLLAKLDAAFGRRPEFLARSAVVRCAIGDPHGGALDLRQAAQTAPEATALWAEWGSWPVSRDIWNNPDRLAGEFDRMAAEHHRWSMLFNVGIPFAVPAPR